MTLPTTTPAQIAANRRNAQRSTGPRTDAGKARSSFNGLRHGLYARDVVLPGEDRAAFDDLLDRLAADLAPEGAVEDELVRTAASLWWRLGRSAAIEAGLLNPGWSEDPRAQNRDTGGGPLVDTFRVALDDTKTLDCLGRYEARLGRALSRTLSTLERMQAARRRRALEQKSGRKSQPSKSRGIEKQQ
ncbi:hypothetical protein ACFL12_07520 [Pseudomonadota bacterium]